MPRGFPRVSLQNRGRIDSQHPAISLGKTAHQQRGPNLGRVPLVVEALRGGNLDLLREVMDDRLHQNYRLSHIPAGEAAIETARSFGAAALSGAGPSLITFIEPDQVQQALSAIGAIFEEAGVQARGFVLRTSNLGIQIL